MGAETIAQLIIQFGLPVAQAIYKKLTSDTAITDTDWQELRDMASQTAEDRTKSILVAAGLSLEDPKAQAILALVK